LELLTGRKVVDYSLPRFQQSLITWATPRLSEDKVKQCVDPKLGGAFPLKAVAKASFAHRQAGVGVQRVEGRGEVGGGTRG
jgi:hypothetical protein